MTTDAPVLELHGVSKRFGAVQALSKVDLEVRAGEVTALVGDNGAGKSTLIKAIAGAHPIDAGAISFKGRPVRIGRPHDAQDLGIATVYQDLALCDNLDVVANLFLGREIVRTSWLTRVLGPLAALLARVRLPMPVRRVARLLLWVPLVWLSAPVRLLLGKPAPRPSRHPADGAFRDWLHRQGRVLDTVAMERRARELLETLSIRIPNVRIPVASLSGGQRQVVAIARALVGSPEVVILDEPTAALGVEQTAQVLDLVERLREQGLAVILISHNMADVQAVADEVAVLRLGRNNGRFRVADTSGETIIAAITGAADNAVSRRHSRRDQEPPAGSGADAPTTDGTTDGTEVQP